MAIKILSYNAYPDPKYVSTCSCGCQFTFNKSDTHFDRDSNQSYIECPNSKCGLINYESIWYLLNHIAEKEWQVTTMIQALRIGKLLDPLAQKGGIVHEIHYYERI